jgi:hypothetical protein
MGQRVRNTGQETEQVNTALIHLTSLHLYSEMMSFICLIVEMQSSN